MKELFAKIPEAADLLALEPEQLGGTMLFLLQERRFEQDMFHPLELNAELWTYSHLSGMETYPTAKRWAINDALTEAWAWLERQGLVVPAADHNGANGWRRLAKKAANYKSMADLARSVGPTVLPREMTVIAESRLMELRQLVSSQFDFKKCIRLCEEINNSYSAGNYFATAVLTRGLLDHVPPVLGQTTFNQVVNNYGGTGRSFKDCMEHLEKAARKVADAHLHMPIRSSETLPVAQQVNFAPQLDVLLAEIVRITK